MFCVVHGILNSLSLIFDVFAMGYAGPGGIGGGAGGYRGGRGRGNCIVVTHVLVNKVPPPQAASTGTVTTTLPWHEHIATERVQLSD